MDELPVPRALIALVLAVAPGLYAWWTGRTLAARADDAALPELLLARQQRMSALGIFAAMMVAGLWGWALPLLVIALLAGAWPLRRALFDETWSLRGYMIAQVRAFIGWMGPYLLLALMPVLVLAARPYHLTTAIVLGGLLLLWLHRYGEVWRWGSNASLLQRDDLRPRFEAVIARSNAPMPALHRFGYEGSAMMNAVALPSLRGSAVAFSDRLLERLPADEVAAIFAHEVAHLEHYDARRLQRMRLASWALVVIGIVAPLLALAGSAMLQVVLPWVWPVAVLVALARRAASTQRHETASDRRAVELTGDPEALVRALTALHVAARVPRRWAREFERTASHPSLARRVQAIRAAAATLGPSAADVAVPGALPAAGVATTGLQRSGMEPVVLQSTDAGRWIVLDGDRAHWFEGVADGTAPALAALREHASSYRALRYGDLTELRVAADAARRTLRAVDRAGTTWGVPLQPHDVARAQVALDRVDTALGTPASGRGREELIGRLLAAATALAALVATQFGLVLLPPLVALVKPLPAVLALAGGMSIGRALAAFAEPDIAWTARDERIALVILFVLGAACLRLAFHQRQERVTKSGMTALIALVGMAAGPLLAAALGGAQWRTGVPAAFSLAVALLGVGGALLVMHGRARRAAGLACATIAPVVAMLGLGAERLQGRAPAIEWTRATAVQLARVALPPGANSLRLSPGGARWAVQHHSAESYQRYARNGAWSFVVGDLGGARRTLEAGGVEFLDDDHILVITPLPTATELRLEDAASGTVLRADTLPPMAEAQLWLDRPARRWTVTGGDPDGGFLLRVDGAAHAGTVRVTRLATEGANLVSGVHRDAVSIAVPRRDASAPASALLMLANGLSFSSDLWRVDSGGRRVAGTMDGWPRCAQAGVEEQAICVSTDGRRATLWRIDSAGATRVGAVPVFHSESGFGDGLWAGGSVTAGELLVVDPATRRGLRVALPDSGYATVVQPLRDGAGVLSVSGGETSLVLYRIGDPARATLARP